MISFDGELVKFEEAPDGKLLGVVWRYLNTYFLFGYHRQTNKFVCLSRWKPEGGIAALAPPPVFLAMRGLALDRFAKERARREKLEKEKEEALKNAPPNPYAELDAILGIEEAKPEPAQTKPVQAPLFAEEELPGGSQEKEPCRRFGGRRNPRKLAKHVLPQVPLVHYATAPSHHEARVAHQAKLA